MACGFVANVGQFAAARVLLGVGEAPNFPTGGRVVRDWFSLRERGFATGVFNGASYIGTGIAAPLLTLLMLMWGWRWMFAIMGVLGLGVAVLWYPVYRDPTQAPLTEEEDRYRTAGDAPEAVHPVTLFNLLPRGPDDRRDLTVGRAAGQSRRWRLPAQRG